MKSPAMNFNQEKKSNSFVEKGSVDPNPNKTDEHQESIYSEISEAGDDDGDDKKKALFCRNVVSCVLILLTVIVITIFAILGIIYFPPQKNNRCSVIDFSKGNEGSECKGIYSEKLKSVKHLRIYFQGQLHLSSDIDLQMSHTYVGNWTVQKMKDDKISNEMNTTHQTCNNGGVYLIQYRDSEENIVYEQNKTVIVNANLSPIHVETTPHLTKDGMSKRILLEASMSTGCRHGTIAPVLMKGDNVFFVEKSSCASRFDNRYGGNVTCITDIPESVWKSVDRVITELHPNNNLPSQIKPFTIRTAETNTDDICEQVYLKYSKKGIINCKKLIDYPVAIDIYHQSSLFGNETFLIGLDNTGKYRAVANERFELEATYGNILNFTLSIRNVHCDDQGILKINFSDAAVIHIKVKVQGIPELCEESRSYETSESKNFELECSWCPGHNVSEVTISHIEDVTLHTFHKPTGNVYPPYPVKIDMTKDVTTGGNTNVTIVATIEYGLLKIKINAYRTACNYDEYYVFKASSPEGESEKLVNVTIKAPSLSFMDELNVPAVFVQDTEAKVTFQGFLGCFPSAIEVKKDGASISPQSVLQYDDVRARIVKIEWLFDPVDKTKHDKNKLTAEVTFTRASGITNTYYKETSIEVLDNSLCSDKGPSPQGCWVQHPTDNKQYVTCSPALTIIAAETCPSGLVFKPDSVCSGKCDYPTTNGKK